MLTRHMPLLCVRERASERDIGSMISLQELVHAGNPQLVQRERPSCMCQHVSLQQWGLLGLTDLKTFFFFKIDFKIGIVTVE